MALCEKIVIAGFSGAGKSSFLKEIAAIAPVEWESFDDLDNLVLKRKGKGHKSLSSLIEEVGWDQFRLWERQELDSWLKEEGRGVLAMGGGTLSALVWDVYKSSRKIKFCYLHASFETCWDRLIKSSEVRPLVLKGKEELKKVFGQRELIFEQIEWRFENEGQTDLKKLAQAFWQG